MSSAPLPMLAALFLTVACGSSDTAPSKSPVLGDAAVGGAASSSGGASSSSSGATGSSGSSNGSGGAVSLGGGGGAAGRVGGGGSGGLVGGGGGISIGGQGGSFPGCTAVGSACDPAHITCCGGLVCVTSTSADYAGCRQPCAVGGSDCGTGCCIAFGNFPDKGFCGSPSLCQCSGKDEPCGGTRHCCTGMTCTTFDATDTLGCEPKCTTNADCLTTNCCVAIPSTPDSACLAPVYCGK